MVALLDLSQCVGLLEPSHLYYKITKTIKMMKKTMILLLLIWVNPKLFAQQLTQTIRGTIVDEDTQLPLIGATISLLDVDPMVGTTTDENGKFRLEDVPTGRVTLQMSYLGYKDKLISNMEVNSAKEIVLDISLVESSVKMEEVVVRATSAKGNALNDLALVSARSVSTEQTSRYAGGFNDPSRILSNFAGVTNTQDGGNDIIIRGNSPKYVQWRLEGVQISNPNHFADQNAVSGPLQQQAKLGTKTSAKLSIG